MKKAEKSIFAKSKPLWDNGKKLSPMDAKIGFCVKNFALNQVFSAFKQNKNCLNETERKEFEQMIVELQTEKKALGPDHMPSQEEYSLFLEGMFANVDDEDRHGGVTLKTSASFKLVSELIEVMTQWGEIPENWAKRSKYCKFKALDIFKAIKAGQVPKRGGPKEEVDEISKELNSMIDSQKNEQPTDENVNLKPANDVNMEGSDSNYNPSSNTDEFKSKLKINPDYQNNLNTLNSFSIPNNKPTDNQNQNINPDINTTFNTNLNSNNLYKNNSSDSAGTLNIKRNFNTHNNINASMIGDFKIEGNKLAKKLDFKLPVKYKGVDYFRLCDNIKKQLDAGEREMLSNKTDKALQYMELAYYYITNIEK